MESDPFPSLQAEPQPQPDPPQVSRQDSGFVTFKRSHLYSVLLPLAFVAGLGVGFLFWGRTTPAPTPSAAVGGASTSSAANGESSANPAGEKPTRYNVPDDGDPSLGPRDAPITMIEFSDYECPFCQKWHAEVFKSLMDAYPNKIRFVYRDFPLAGIHSNATAAAEAADCAGEQNKYWDYYNKLFAQTAGLNSKAYSQYAGELGLDLAKFNDCVSTRKYKDEVSADYDFAANLGIRSTPTFFINGLAVVGAQSLDTFKSIIDQELAGKIP